MNSDTKVKRSARKKEDLVLHPGASQFPLPGKGHLRLSPFSPPCWQVWRELGRKLRFDPDEGLERQSLSSSWSLSSKEWSTMA